MASATTNDYLWNIYKNEGPILYRVKTNYEPKMNSNFSEQNFKTIKEPSFPVILTPDKYTPFYQSPFPLEEKNFEIFLERDKFRTLSEEGIVFHPKPFENGYQKFRFSFSHSIMKETNIKIISIVYKYDITSSQSNISSFHQLIQKNTSKLLPMKRKVTNRMFETTNKQMKDNNQISQQIEMKFTPKYFFNQIYLIDGEVISFIPKSRNKQIEVNLPSFVDYFLQIDTKTEGNEELFSRAANYLEINYFAIFPLFKKQIEKKSDPRKSYQQISSDFWADVVYPISETMNLLRTSTIGSYKMEELIIDRPFYSHEELYDNNNILEGELLFRLSKANGGLLLSFKKNTGEIVHCKVFVSKETNGDHMTEPVILYTLCDCFNCIRVYTLNSLIDYFFYDRKIKKFIFYKYNQTTGYTKQSIHLNSLVTKRDFNH